MEYLWLLFCTYSVIECKHWLINCETGFCAKRQSIIASYDNYDTYVVLTHESGNMQTQTVVASTCKSLPFTWGWTNRLSYTDLFQKLNTECCKKLQCNIVTSIVNTYCFCLSPLIWLLHLLCETNVHGFQ